MMTYRTYSELLQIPLFIDTVQYLMTPKEDFGTLRYLNQLLYQDEQWKHIRNQIVLRDSGKDYCYDLGCLDHPITGSIYVHHINPITVDDILQRRAEVLYNPDNLICCSKITHEAIHNMNKDILPTTILERSPNDMCPWKS